MTTAHRPTFHPAVGTANPGGYRYYAPKAQFSAQDLPSQLTLKTRRVGQGSAAEIEQRDLKAELLKREAEHFQKKEDDRRRTLGLPLLTNGEAKIAGFSGGTSAEAGVAVGDAAGGGSGAAPGSLNLDNVDFSKFDDADDSESSGESDSDSSDDSDGERAALMRELARIRKEREEERVRKQMEDEAAKSRQREDEARAGNPLMNLGGGGDFRLKRRWYEDTVFKNQAREVKKAQKRFINDTTRNDFHRKFLNKYIK